MIRILNVEPEGYCEEARSLLNRLGELVEAQLDRSELLLELPRYDVLIVRLKHQIDREVIDVGHRLKAIVSATTGIDHIDLEYAERRGVAVLSLRGETEFLGTISATAEHTWALLLALLRQVPQAFASVQGGVWDRDLFRGRELDSKRLGIVGLGRIGRKVARYGQAFGMDVAAFDPYASEWVEGVERVSLSSDLLRRADVLTLHVPLTQETSGLIGGGELSLLPRGSVLVNTSRGDVVEETALVEALESGHLSGAALDVIRNERGGEPPLQNRLLVYARQHGNLLITPHVGGATHESMAKTELFMARKLVAFLSDPQTADPAKSF